MYDEYTDVLNKQQLSFCVWWGHNFLNVHEDFLGFYQLPDIKSNNIVNAIKDILTRFNLPLLKLREQTSWQKSGVAKQIKEMQPKQSRLTFMDILRVFRLKV